jgi:thiol-disulfide isomerase/thioredoxin
METRKRRGVATDLGRVLLAGAAAALLAACASTGATTEASNGAPADEPAATAQPAPPTNFTGKPVRFTAPRLWSQWDPEPPGGETSFSMRSLDDRVTIVHFWASWCEPCKRSMPYFDGLLKTHEGQPLDVVAVNMDEDRALAVLFLDNVPTSFVNVWDQGSKISGGLGVGQLPLTLLLDGRQIVQHAWRGEDRADREVFEREMEALLKQVQR